jgi:hypothetical protein
MIKKAALCRLCYYLPRYYVCTCYADCKRLVSELRFNIYIFLGLTNLLEYLAEKIS